MSESELPQNEELEDCIPLLFSHYQVYTLDLHFSLFLIFNMHLEMFISYTFDS
jgi:hypothetical protein